MKNVNLPGCEHYLITPDGVVTNSRTGRQLKPFLVSSYLRVELCASGKKIRKHIHRLLMLTYRPIAGMENLVVDHIDGNKMNNRLENLRWVTSRENALHNVSLGINPHGIKHGCARLTEGDVIEIRRSYVFDGNKRSNAKQLAIKHGVSTATITRIIGGNGWRHLFRTEESK